MHRKSGIIAVLDIGDTKVVCFIAQVDHDGEMRIIGIGHQVARGMKTGLVTDMSELEKNVVAAVHAAESMAQETIENVVVNLSCSHLLSQRVRVALETADGTATYSDIQDLLRLGAQMHVKPGMELVHCVSLGFAVDEHWGIRDPRGQVCRKLGAEMLLVQAPSSLQQNLTNCVERCHLNITRFVASSYASALACLDEDEMALGVTHIDMGGGSTSVAVFADGKLVHVDAIPIGGIHVTSDIAKGLTTQIAHAERIKTLHGSAILGSHDNQGEIEVRQLGEDDGNSQWISPSFLTTIIRPRLEEIFEMVRSRLEEVGMDKVAGRRVVLTGGGSQLLGISQLASQVMSKQVRIARPKEIEGLAEAVSGGAFSTAVGMLKLAERDMAEGEFSFSEPRFESRGILQKLGRFLGSFFR